MYTETAFFASVVQEDHSILDFIDGKYTFLNERLANFYGIPGVEGNAIPPRCRLMARSAAAFSRRPASSPSLLIPRALRLFCAANGFWKTF